MSPAQEICVCALLLAARAPNRHVGNQSKLEKVTRTKRHGAKMSRRKHEVNLFIRLALVWPNKGRYSVHTFLGMPPKRIFRQQGGELS